LALRAVHVDAVKPIVSPANARFRHWSSLASSPRAVRESRSTLAEGVHLADAALAGGAAIEAVLVRRGADTPQVRMLVERLRSDGRPMFELSSALYDRVCGVERGVGLTLVIGVPAPQLEAAGNSDLLVLDGVQDPGNAGALVRVAAAAGIRHVLSSSTSTSLWAPKALRAGQGAHFGIAIIEGVDLGRLRELHRVTWVGTALDGATSLWRAAFPATPLGWIVGAEGQGISPVARALCSQLVRIPVDPAVESLNVVAAAAVCLFERRRQLDTGGY
jgi:TrmH family RNA methyltransferase